MSVTPSPIGGFAAQFFDNNGVILSGGKIYTYAAGTTTPQATYTSASGVTPHANPIILDSAGRVPGGEIWLTDGLVYKFTIETATSILLGTYDNITGVNSNFVNYTVQEEVITATAGQTVFNLSTINYTPGTNSLTVYIDGVNQYVGDSYIETDSNTVTFTSGVHVGGEVKFTTAVQSTTGAVDASIVSYEPPFTGGVATNVEAKLAQYVSVKDFGAVGNGVTDDAAAIQLAINTGKSLFFPAGTYMVSVALLPASNTTWEGGNAAELKWTTLNSTIYANGISNWTIRNFRINGNYTAYSITSGPDTPYGIKLESSININIENNKIFNCYRIGVAVGLFSLTRCQFVRVTGNEIYDIGRATDPVVNFGNGVAVLSASDVVIRDNWIYNITGNGAGTGGVNLEPPYLGQDCYNIEIASNRITNCNNCPGVNVYTNAVFTGSRSNINIHDNEIAVTGTSQGIRCEQFGDTFIRNNYLANTQGILVKRYAAFKATVDGNTILSVTGASGYGIRFQDGAAAAFVNNNKLNNINGVGISVDIYDLVTAMSAKQCTIQGNTINGANGTGIALSVGNFSVSGNVLIDCTFTNPAGYFLTGLAGGVFASINGYIGDNTFISSAGAAAAFLGIDGNLFNNVTFGENSFVGPLAKYSTLLLAGRCPGVYMNILPTGGNWQVGDVIYKATPTDGGYIGWVCRVAGSIGTWEEFGWVGDRWKNSVAAAPDFFAQLAVVAGIGYIATGVSSSADWKQIT